MQFPDREFVTKNPKETFTRFFNEEGYSDNDMAGSVRDYFLAQSDDKLDINFEVVGPYTTEKSSDTKGLLIRKQGNEVKKVIVK